jgi:hypothetical protein
LAIQGVQRFPHVFPLRLRLCVAALARENQQEDERNQLPTKHLVDVACAVCQQKQR